MLDLSILCYAYRFQWLYFFCTSSWWKCLARYLDVSVFLGFRCSLHAPWQLSRWQRRLYKHIIQLEQPAKAYPLLGLVSFVDGQWQPRQASLSLAKPRWTGLMALCYVAIGLLNDEKNEKSSKTGCWEGGSQWQPVAAVTFMWQHSLHGQCGYCCNNRGGQYQEQCVLTVPIDSDACMLKSGQMAERPLVGVFPFILWGNSSWVMVGHGACNRLLLAFLGVPRLDVFPWQAAQRGRIQLVLDLLWHNNDMHIHSIHTHKNTHTQIYIYIHTIIYIYIHTI